MPVPIHSQKHASTEAPTNFQYFSRLEYYEDLARRISHAEAGERVVLMTMSFKPEKPGLEAIVDALCSAARKGANVDFLVDAYPFIMSDARPGPLFFKGELPTKLPEPYRTRFDILQRIEAAGGRYKIINWPKRSFANPFSGRSHMKLGIIGNYVYTGGCNLNPRDHIDVMVGWEDGSSADWLYNITQRIIAEGSVYDALAANDTLHKIDETTTLLIDAGIRNQSIIYQNALELIDAAVEELFMTCQYFPNGETIKRLHRAEKRGVKVKILFGNPAQHPIPFNLLHHGVKNFERLRRPESFFNDQLPKHGPTLHAKVLISEKAAMVGSHNYVPAGVKWGTAEIALRSEDKNFIKNLQNVVAK